MGDRESVPVPSDFDVWASEISLPLSCVYGYGQEQPNKIPLWQAQLFPDARTDCRFEFGDRRRVAKFTNHTKRTEILICVTYRFTGKFYRATGRTSFPYSMTYSCGANPIRSSSAS